MPNRLANENSPYLLQHKDNPVDWYPWGPEALHRAKEENKPIFLSIGYAACHWCHVMEHESFENEATAAYMNEHFINIKVDREERPDLDRIYMDAVVAMTQQGGWPMSVFLTPEGKPFYGGTYFPPVPSHGMPSFTQILQSVQQVWEETPEKVYESGQSLTDHLLERGTPPAPGEAPQLDPAIPEQAALKLAQSYDRQHGGWGAAPKFPQPMAIRYLLRRAYRGDGMARQTAAHALQAMAKGGMYDLIGGGFARYSVDNQWLVPHFEKMLYDNAQLARAYLHAYLVTGEDYYRQVCEETLDFVLAEMTHPRGGFYSSIDADSEGEEGKFYVWAYDEVAEILDEEELAAFTQAYTLTPGGNFEGQNVFQRKIGLEALAEMEDVLAPARQKLYQERAKRVRPATDDKVLTAWNAWMATAFAEAARYLDRPDYLQAAQNNLGFLLKELWVEGNLLRSWRAGKALHRGYLEDYASLALALLALYQSDPNPEWYRHAVTLVEEIFTHFRGEAGNLYDTANDHETLILRPQETQDNATPSGASLAAEAFLQLAAYTGESRYTQAALQAIAPIQEVLTAYPTAFGNWLNALDFALAEVQEVAILGDPADRQTQGLLAAVWAQYRPDLVLAASPVPVPEGSPPLLADRVLVNDQPTAYVCRNFACRLPVNTVEKLREQLAG